MTDAESIRRSRGAGRNPLPESHVAQRQGHRAPSACAALTRPLLFWWGEKTKDQSEGSLDGPECQGLHFAVQALSLTRRQCRPAVKTVRRRDRCL